MTLLQKFLLIYFKVNFALLTATRLRAVKIGMTKAAVMRVVGAPREVSLVYTTTLHDQSYRVRAVTLAADRVVKKEAEFYVD